jgi:preprotein translocase subunit SecE
LLRLWAFNILGDDVGRILKKKSPEERRKKRQMLEADENRSPSSSTNGHNSATISAGSSKRQFGVLKSKPAESKSIAVKAEQNFIGKSIQFLREVKVELKKVTWSSRKQTLGSTAVVIVLVLIISLFLGIVDIGLTGILRGVLG